MCEKVYLAVDKATGNSFSAEITYKIHKDGTHEVVSIKRTKGNK